ncbi:PBP1A family penicillin-binding protein [Myxococcota bacterium]|nr:PBP1A family penicillin-binding protein [Myxococcota bacterium]
MAFSRSRGFRILFGGLVVCSGLALAGAGLVYWHILRDLPDWKTLEDYQPPLSSRVLDRHGRVLSEFYVERRRLTSLDELPPHVIDAFVASEDSSFFEHSGIDFRSILRAAWVNLQAGGATKQGGSTITQQMVKGLLLSPERSYRRKLREAILAWQIEKRFEKEDILYLYLNQIYFGHGAYGIGEAASTYFGKPPGELTISESALLAGLPKAPSRYSPFANPAEAEKRRVYVLSRMREEGNNLRKPLSRATYEAAMAEVPVLVDSEPNESQLAARYFVEEVRRYLFSALGGDSVLQGGLTIETTLDADLQRAATAALKKGLDDLDRRQGYRESVRLVPEKQIPEEIRLAGERNEIDPSPNVSGTTMRGTDDRLPADAILSQKPTFIGVVTEVDPDAQSARVAFAPGIEGVANLPEVAWARPADPDKRPQPVKAIEEVLARGQVAIFERVGVQRSEDGSEEVVVTLHQAPIVQGALLSIDVTTDEVIALVGGYEFDQSQFNRVTQAKRQPGSAFKPLIYGAALDKGYTPASIIRDTANVYVDETSGFIWRPRNYGRNFYGPITLREALARSVNNATVHLFRDIGVDYVIDYARQLGIKSPMNRDLSLALGASDLSLLELTQAYATYPAAGRKVIPTFIRRVTDGEGNILLENIALGDDPSELLEPSEPMVEEEAVTVAVMDEPDAADAPDERVEAEEPELPAGYLIRPESAYLVTDLLHAVVADPRGTGWRLRALGRPLAGKTGTTNDQADAWFMGFSPEIMTGVWVGHDESRFLGWGETGSRAAAPIWVDYMRSALANRPVRSFTPPEPIIFARIDRKTGLLAGADSTDTVFQAFLTGTEPTRTATAEKSDTEIRRELRIDSF